MTEKKLCAKQMFDEWGPKFGLSEEENNKAIDEAYKALDRFFKNMRAKAKEALNDLKRKIRLV